MTAERGPVRAASAVGLEVPDEPVAVARDHHVTAVPLEVGLVKLLDGQGERAVGWVVPRDDPALPLHHHEPLVLPVVLQPGDRVRAWRGESLGEVPGVRGDHPRGVVAPEHAVADRITDSRRGGVQREAETQVRAGELRAPPVGEPAAAAVVHQEVLPPGGDVQGMGAAFPLPADLCGSRRVVVEPTRVRQGRLGIGELDHTGAGHRVCIGLSGAKAPAHVGVEARRLAAGGGQCRGVGGWNGDPSPNSGLVFLP
jgi:hypothetical protein